MCMIQPPSINDVFLRLKPVVERHAQVVFRHLAWVDREEAMAEAVAGAFQSYLSLLRRGKDPFKFPRMIAARAVQHVLNGRRVGTRRNGRDVFARAGRLRHAFWLCPLLHDHDWSEALIDNRKTPVPDQVSFRCDFPRWLDTLTPRDRAIAILLSTGNSTKSMAKRFGLSAARISQLRTEFYALWQNFHGEPTSSPNSARTVRAHDSSHRINEAFVACSPKTEESAHSS